MSGYNIAKENDQPGKIDWQLQTPVGPQERDPTYLTIAARSREEGVEGYAGQTSYLAGDTVDLYVSTKAPWVIVSLFRIGYYKGAGGRRIPLNGRPNVVYRGWDWPVPSEEKTHMVGRREWTRPGAQSPTYWVDCESAGWKETYWLYTGEDWPSGVYLVKLTAAFGPSDTQIERIGKQSYIIFVLRAREPHEFMFQCSVTTYQAYNGWGGFSFYDYNTPRLDGQDAPYLAGQTVVSFNRPYMIGSAEGAKFGSGAGHFLTNDKPNYEIHKGGTPEGQLAQPDWVNPAGWEINMVRWLEAKGYDVSYCTNIDVHRYPNLLHGYKGFLSVGHDEYWSAEMRLNIERARDAGLNIAFFSGNTVWNVVSFSDNFRTMIKEDLFSNTQPPYLKPNGPDKWYEETLTGGTWCRGGDFDLEMTPGCEIPFMVQGKPFTLLPGGTGKILLGIGGYEPNARPSVVGVRTDAFMPAGSQVVFRRGGETWYRDAGTECEGVLYQCPNGNLVFSAATVQWSWGLDDFTVQNVPGFPGYSKGPRRPNAPPSRADRKAIPYVETITTNLLEAYRSYPPLDLS